jgi:MYXO-CTERM domain-containing protein
MNTHRVVLLAVLCGALLAPLPAGAYCLTKYGTATKWAAWPQQRIKYRVSSNLTDAAILGAIDKAFQTWDAVTCSKISFQKAPAFPNNTPFQNAPDHINIFWVTKPSEAPSGMGSNYAYHFIGWGVTGDLVQTAVAFNAHQYKWSASGTPASDTFDVQNVVTHYVGLLIGLGYSQQAGKVMTKGEVTFGQVTKRTLTQDDINALVALYPSGTCPAPPPPDASCAATPPPPTEAGVPKNDSGTTPPPPGKDSTTPPPAGDGPPIGPVSEAGVPITPQTDAAIPGSDSGGSGGGEDDGCGCHVGGPARRSPLRPGLLLAALALALLLVTRRRA